MSETERHHPAATAGQIDALMEGLRDAPGHDLVGAYLHGSGVLGGFRRDSDIDVVVVSARRTLEEQKRCLIDLLLAIRSDHGADWSASPRRRCSPRRRPRGGRGRGSRSSIERCSIVLWTPTSVRWRTGGTTSCRARAYADHAVWEIERARDRVQR